MVKYYKFFLFLEIAFIWHQAQVSSWIGSRYMKFQRLRLGQWVLENSIFHENGLSFQVGKIKPTYELAIFEVQHYKVVIDYLLETVLIISLR